MSINRYVAVGNLTHDVEMRKTKTGSSVMNFTVAVNNRVKNSQTGEWESLPCYVPCVMFGSRADSISNMIHKGSKVGIDGHLSQNNWEDKQGNRRSKLEVIVEEIDLNPDKGKDRVGYYDDYSDAF